MPQANLKSEEIAEEIAEEIDIESLGDGLSEFAENEQQMESDEIDLKPVEDEITQFSDDENIPVEHVNFEFEQSNALQGMYREFTVFNDSQCYQKVKHKHRRKYKFRVDLAYLDPRPFRIRNIVWKWLYASLALWAVDAILLIGGFFDRTSVVFLGSVTAITVAALLTMLIFFYLSNDTVYFRSRFGKIRLLELAHNNPDKESFRAFINKVVVQINKSKSAKGMNQSQMLASELKELRRLKDESVIPNDSYEKAKKLIFSHKAFSATE